MTLLLHNNISLQIYISNPDYGLSCGRFWEKQKTKKQKNKSEDSAHHYLLRYNMRRLDTHSKKKTKTVVQSQSQCQIAFGRSFTAVSI